MDSRKISRRDRERMFPRSDYHLINRYLAYKLDQIRQSIKHYKSIPKRQRTQGDINALQVAVIWERCILWTFPGGRGEPTEEGGIDGQQS